MTPDAATEPNIAPAPTSAARAEAARRNGARSRGPVTAEGKARSAKNARKHGLCATAPADDAGRAELEALTRELAARYRPEGALEGRALSQLAHALWRLAKADEIEMALLVGGVEAGDGEAALTGADLFRHPGGQRALGLLLRYRGAAERTLARSRRMLDDMIEGRAGAPPAADPSPDIDALLACLEAAMPGHASPTAGAERTQAPPSAPPPPALNRRDRRRLAALERRVAA